MFLPKFCRVLGLGLLLSLSAQGATEVNGIAAVANGRPITKRELAFMVAPLQRQLMTRYPRRGPAFHKELNKVYDEVLEELIDRQLILSEFEANAAGQIPDEAVDRAIDREIQTLYNGSEKEFREMLGRLRMTRAKYEDLTREKLIVQAMRAQQFNDAAPPTPDEVRAEYNREKSNYRDVREDRVVFEKIFIPKVREDRIVTPEEQLTLTEKLMADIKAGADFAALAREHSADAYAEDGGRTEELPRTDLSPDFASIIFAEDIGTLIGPLEDGGGYTIVRVISVKKGPPPPYAKLREQMEANVQRKKNNERYERWIKRVRERSIIKRKD